jgi:hypothetical protein
MWAEGEPALALVPSPSWVRPFSHHIQPRKCHIFTERPWFRQRMGILAWLEATQKTSGFLPWYQCGCLCVWWVYITPSCPNHLDSNGPLMRLCLTEQTIPELTQSPQLSQLLLLEIVKGFIAGLHSGSNHNEWLGIRVHSRAWFRVPSQCWVLLA